MYHLDLLKSIILKPMDANRVSRCYKKGLSVDAVITPSAIRCGRFLQRQRGRAFSWVDSGAEDPWARGPLASPWSNRRYERPEIFSMLGHPSLCSIPHLMPHDANEFSLLSFRQFLRNNVASREVPMHSCRYASVGCVHGFIWSSTLPCPQHHSF